MNMTIILVLDDNDIKTKTIISVNAFPSDNPYKYGKIECNDMVLEPYLIHIAGTDRTLKINQSDNMLRFDSRYKIKISGKCLIAISHFNILHSNDQNNNYFKCLNYNQTFMQELPLFLADYSKPGWQCIDQMHLISASKIKSTGIDNLIEDFESSNCQNLMKLYNIFIAED